MRRRVIYLASIFYAYQSNILIREGKKRMEKSFEEHKAELELEVQANGGENPLDKYMTEKDHIAELEQSLAQTKQVNEAKQDATASQVNAEDVVEGVEDNDNLLEQQAQQLKDREAELFNKEVAMTFRENGLEMFNGVIKPTDPRHLDELVHNLTKIVNEIKVGSGYIPPKENGVQAEYDIAKEKGDTKSMIKNLFGFSK